jgi:hypothetical protein
MEQTTTNPLFKHFRQPAIYLKLPSQGKFYPNGTLTISVTGDIPVYPMTVKDELTLKTPDALMNGEGMASIIRSCCPAITDPWVIPAVDLDAIFIAIRLASYGTAMDFATTCPHCNEEGDHAVNLTNLLEKITPANYNDVVSIDNLTFKFKSQCYKDVNKINIATFEERKLINNVVDSDLSDEEKRHLFDESFKKITQLNVEVLIDSIESITVDGKVVTDFAVLKEFLDNCSLQTYNAIKDKIQSLIEQNKIKPIKLTCTNEACGKDYETNLTFDQSNFFG